MLVTLFKQLNLVTLKSFRFEQLVRTVLLITVVAISPPYLCHFVTLNGESFSSEY